MNVDARLLKQRLKLFAKLKDDANEWINEDDALRVAEIVLCEDVRDEPTAQELLERMGYIAWTLAGWEQYLSPETRAKANQIRSLTLLDTD